MEFGSTKWLWLYAGVILMLLEMALPGFVIFFFGLSALTVGLLLFICGEGCLSMSFQMALFSGLSVVFILTLRRLVKSVFKGNSSQETPVDSDYVGRRGVVRQAIVPPEEGRIELGDAQWTARAQVPLQVGVHVRVIAQQNLTMVVEEVSARSK